MRHLKRGFTVWITGLPRAGKTTLGRMLTKALADAGVAVEHFDGDEIRKRLWPELGFSKEERHENNLRVAWVAGMLNRHGVVAVVSQIAPYRATRMEVRRRIGEYIEVFADCPLEQLINRDYKGLYKKALAGEIKGFTGIDDPYEPPENPEVHCRTDLESPQESLKKILSYLAEAGLLTPDEHSMEPGLSPSQEEIVLKRLEELGYL